jgi:hypothetical protein
MASTVTARDGDTLCTIAAANGFDSCVPLRQVQTNIDRGYCNNALKAGDLVDVPDPAPREEAGRDTEARHDFEAPNMPPPGIRFVHGSQTTPYSEDPNLTFLNVSNYQTDKAGTNGRQAWPTAYGFNQHADADPDVFKIEVVDPNAGSDTVEVDLKAMKPVYEADGSLHMVDGQPQYVDFTTELSMRQIRPECRTVNSARQVRFRSAYMRLVVDDEDSFAICADNQALLVTDTADGNNGDNDKVEILDQIVVASYELLHCQAPAGQAKCRAEARVPVGENRRRIRLCVHVFRETVGGANAGNITEQNVRYRTAKWFRRAYAQINMAPKLVPCGAAGAEIEFIDPPADNMITISQEHGLPVSAAGGPYQITFRLGLPPGDVAAAETAATAAGLTPGDARPTIQVNLTNGWTPEQVANTIVTLINGLTVGFSALAYRNARGFTATNRSYDVLITRTDNLRVMIENENLTAGAGITLDVARVNTASVTGAIPNSLPVLPASLRRLIREAPGTDDRLDTYVCRGFTEFGGLGIIPHSELAADFQPDSPMRWAIFCESPGNAVMDGSDNYPWTYPHEAGHVLPDAFHIDSASPHDSTCLMRGIVVLSQAYPVDGTKRIFDTPVTVRYAHWDPAQPTVGATITETLNMAQRFRDKSGSVTEAW